MTIDIARHFLSKHRGFSHTLSSDAIRYWLPGVSTFNLILKHRSEGYSCIESWYWYLNKIYSHKCEYKSFIINTQLIQKLKNRSLTGSHRIGKTEYPSAHEIDRVCNNTNRSVRLDPFYGQWTIAMAIRPGIDAHQAPIRRYVGVREVYASQTMPIKLVLIMQMDC